jgi:hypothetical protein
MTEQPPNRPEMPRQEPEIIPPGEEPRVRHDRSAIFVTVGPDGTERVRVFKPGLGSLLLLTLGIAFLVALILVVFFGAVLIFVPLIVVLFAAAVLVGLWQRFWYRRPR